MIIQGAAVFTCPRTKKQVTLHRECLNADGKGNRCVLFKHWMWTGAHPTLCCDYKQEPEKPTTEDQKEELEDNEPEGTGRDWRQPDFVEGSVQPE